jgi:hypothetical protein
MAFFKIGIHTSMWLERRPTYHGGQAAFIIYERSISLTCRREAESRFWGVPAQSTADVMIIKASKKSASRNAPNPLWWLINPIQTGSDSRA